MSDGDRLSHRPRVVKPWNPKLIGVFCRGLNGCPVCIAQDRVKAMRARLGGE